MNAAAWDAHMLAENERLRREVARLRDQVSKQRARAEHWRHRARTARTVKHIYTVTVKEGVAC